MIEEVEYCVLLTANLNIKMPTIMTGWKVMLLKFSAKPASGQAHCKVIRAQITKF